MNTRLIFTTVNHAPWYDHMDPWARYVQKVVDFPVFNIRMSEFFLSSFPNNDRVLVFGDVNVMPLSVIRTNNVYIMFDSPLIDCNSIAPYKSKWVWLPSSQFDREVLENCQVKNITEVVHKPMYVPPEIKAIIDKRTPNHITIANGHSETVSKEADASHDQDHHSYKFDMYANLTQDERKGHDMLLQVLHEVDDHLERDVKLLSVVANRISPYFKDFKHIHVTTRPALSKKYGDHLMDVSQARILLFSSYVEGIGLPPIEASMLGQQLVMGDISASNEFVEARFSPIVKLQLVKHSVMNHYFLFQIPDPLQYFDILMKALDDPTYNIPKLKDPHIADFDYIWKQVSSIMEIS